MKKSIFMCLSIFMLLACGGENEDNLKSKVLNDKGPVKKGKAALKVEGINVPETISLDTTKLFLNGVGVRNKFHLKVYIASLYLMQKSSDPVSIINSDKPQAMVLDMTSILMTSSNMSKYIIEAFEKSTGGNTAPIQSTIDLVLSIFNSEPVHKGDKYELFYLPSERGIKAYKNGNFITYFGADINMKKIIFGIWLGDDPVDEGLKAGILGLDLN